MARQVVVDIIGDSKKYTKATDDAVKSSKGLSGTLDKLDAKLTGLGRRGGIAGALMGGAGVGVGLGVFSLVERGVSSVANALGDAVQAAIEDEKATAQLTQTIKANVKAWDGNLDVVNQAIDAGAQLAFTDDDIREGLNQLIPRTHDLTEAIKLNRLAMDLARAKGMGLEEAATLVGKAFSGQVSALRRAGIAIKNTKDSTKALAELQAAVSGQADTYADSTEGAMKRLDIQMSEALESLGYALKPLVASLASLASAIIPQVVSAIGLFGEAMHNLQRIADGNLAATEDLNYAIIAQASAYGVSADKVIAYKDAIVAARKEAAFAADLVGRMQAQFSANDAYFIQQAKVLKISADEAKNRFIVGQVGRLQMLARSFGLTMEQLQEQMPLLLNTGDTVESFLQKVQGLADGYAELDGEAAPVTQTLAEQGLEFVRLYAASEKVAAAGAIVVGAFEGMFASARKAGPALKQPAIWTQRTVDRMQGTLRAALDPYRNAWKQLAEWAKDPFRPKVFADKIKEYHDTAIRKAREAAKNGKPKVAERWREVAKAMSDPIAIAALNIGLSVEQALAAIATVRRTKTVLGNIKDIITGIGNGTPAGKRASGGPVSAGRSYIVGERGPERLTMGAQSGYITPNHRMGGGATYNINVSVSAGVSPAQVGKELVAAIQAYQRNGGAAHVKRAVLGG